MCLQCEYTKRISNQSLVVKKSNLALQIQRKLLKAGINQQLHHQKKTTRTGATVGLPLD